MSPIGTILPQYVTYCGTRASVRYISFPYMRYDQNAGKKRNAKKLIDFDKMIRFLKHLEKVYVGY